ncbi:NAD-dependent epimerase/dehydratase family protein [Alcanivoracaceae bacterium MT1]
MTDSTTTLVTGAAGLIGRRVVDLLRATGREVLATDVRRADDVDAPFLELDLRDRDAVNALADRGIDAIVHCGGFSGPMVGTSTPQLLLDVNVGGTANLLELGRTVGARRFVFASTATVYGPTIGDFVDESVLPRPANIYSASKFACEQLVDAYAAHYSEGTLSLRLAWVYGPHRTTDCVVRDMLTAALDGGAFEADFGEGFPRQFIHVDDAAQAFQLALDAAAPRLTAYNITGEERHDLDEVGALVRERFPSADIRLAPGPDPLDVEQARFHTTAARTDLGFVPAIPLSEGIASYAAWLADTRAAAA